MMASIFSRLGLSLTRSLAVPSRQLCEKSQCYVPHRRASHTHDQGEQQYTSEYFQGVSYSGKVLVVTQCYRL